MRDTGSPSTRTLPVVGRYTRVMTLKRVVLPAPFGPINATTSPASTVKETRSSATTPPKRTLSSRTSSSVISAKVYKRSARLANNRLARGSPVARRAPRRGPPAGCQTASGGAPPGRLWGGRAGRPPRPLPGGGGPGARAAATGARVGGGRRGRRDRLQREARAGVRGDAGAQAMKPWRVARERLHVRREVAASVCDRSSRDLVVGWIPDEGHRFIGEEGAAVDGDLGGGIAGRHIERKECVGGGRSRNW